MDPSIDYSCVSAWILALPGYCYGLNAEGGWIGCSEALKKLLPFSPQEDVLAYPQALLFLKSDDFISLNQEQDKGWDTLEPIESSHFPQQNIQLVGEKKFLIQTHKNIVGFWWS